jgi:putative ABC transport system permease protein
MITIRPDEGDAVRAFFSSAGCRRRSLVPLVRARLTAINGVSVDRIMRSRPRARPALSEREANLTWRAAARRQPVARRALVERRGRRRARVSVEQEYAETLGLKLTTQSPTTSPVKR